MLPSTIIRLHSQLSFGHLRRNSITLPLTRSAWNYSRFDRHFATRRRMTSLKYLLVLDFEATCGDAVSCNEIIEFPTLVYDLKEEKVQATFHEYVRPVIHPTLTEFCTNLTGISQVRNFLVRFSRFLLISSICIFVSTYRTLWTKRIPFQMYGIVTENS